MVILSKLQHHMHWKFCDDISKGSGVIMPTNKQTEKSQTDITENNTTLAERDLITLSMNYDTNVPIYNNM